MANKIIKDEVLENHYTMYLCVSCVQAVQPFCVGFQAWYIKTQSWKQTQNTNSANSENMEENT